MEFETFSLLDFLFPSSDSKVSLLFSVRETPLDSVWSFSHLGYSFSHFGYTSASKGSKSPIKTKIGQKQKTIKEILTKFLAIRTNRKKYLVKNISKSLYLVAVQVTKESPAQKDLDYKGFIPEDNQNGKYRKQESHWQSKDQVY